MLNHVFLSEHKFLSFEFHRELVSVNHDSIGSFDDSCEVLHSVERVNSGKQSDALALSSQRRSELLQVTA